MRLRRASLLAPTIALLLPLISACGSSSSSSSSSSGIGSLSFSDFTVELLSYGQSSNAFSVIRSKARTTAKTTTKALTSTSSGSSYCSLVEFYLGEESSTILGFRVYRSTDGSTYTEIGTENYGTLTSASSLGSPFYYYDYDATLTLGTTYYYKVQAFDSSGNLSAMSPVASATFQQPFTVALTSPTSGTTTGVSSSSRTFSFTLTSASLSSLWSSSYSDYFYFSLLIKNKTGTPAYYGEFRYNFSSSAWQAPGSYSSYGAANWSNPTTVTSGGISYSSSSETISVNLLNPTVSGNDDSYVTSNYGSLSFTSGETYEWDVFGDWEGSNYDDLGTYEAMYPAFFVKATSSSSGTGYGVSYANTYLNGEGSTNGSFSFTY